MKTQLSNLFHGLLLLAGVASATNAQAAVNVYGTAIPSGETIRVDLYANITLTPVMSYSLKVFYDPAVLNLTMATKNEAIWYMSNGSGPVPYMDPDTSQPGEVLMVGAKLDSADPLAGVEGIGVLLGTLLFERRGQQTPTFTLSIGRSGNFASFVTTTGETMEAQPGQLNFGNVTQPRGDQDLDGLRDDWELDHFKDLTLAFYSDDPDGDGVNNQGEEALGSDPADPNSNLRLTVARRGESVWLNWTSFEDRSYTVESGENLGEFSPMKSGIKATPPNNTVELEIPGGTGANFYRILLDQ